MFAYKVSINNSKLKAQYVPAVNTTHLQLKIL